jgi:hypothetical protein
VFAELQDAVFAAAPYVMWGLLAAAALKLWWYYRRARPPR